MEEEKKTADKLPRGNEREEDLNRLTGGSVTPWKKSPPRPPPVVVVTHLHIEGELSKRALAGGGGGKGGIRSKSREDDRG